MTPPDLSTEDGRAAYRRELRRVGWRWRWGGLALIVIAALWVAAARDGGQAWAEQGVMVAYGLLAAGWVMVISSIAMRTRHHRRRMAELDGAAR